MITTQTTLKTLTAGRFFFFDDASNQGEPFKRWFRVSWLEGDGVTQKPRFLFARRMDHKPSSRLSEQLKFRLSKHGNRLVQVQQ